MEGQSNGSMFETRLSPVDDVVTVIGPLLGNNQTHSLTDAVKALNISFLWNLTVGLSWKARSHMHEANVKAHAL